MVVLDTNVVSETMRATPNPEVIAWMDSQRAERLFVAAVTEAEIRAGVAFLPDGARRRNLADAAQRAFGRLFADRILPVDVAVADTWGRMHAIRNVPVVDGLLAATAIVHGLTLVTRNVSHVQGLGADLLNPFTT